jgi:hypothetical protein
MISDRHFDGQLSNNERIEVLGFGESTGVSAPHTSLDRTKYAELLFVPRQRLVANRLDSCPDGRLLTDQSVHNVRCEEAVAKVGVLSPRSLRA